MLTGWFALGSIVALGILRGLAIVALAVAVFVWIVGLL